MKKSIFITVFRHQITPKILVLACLILANACYSLIQRNTELSHTLKVQQHHHKLMKQKILATTHDLKELKVHHADHEPLMIFLAEVLAEELAFERNEEERRSVAPSEPGIRKVENTPKA